MFTIGNGDKLAGVCHLHNDNDITYGRISVITYHGSWSHGPFLKASTVRTSRAWQPQPPPTPSPVVTHLFLGEKVLMWECLHEELPLPVVRLREIVKLCFFFSQTLRGKRCEANSVDECGTKNHNKITQMPLGNTGEDKMATLLWEKVRTASVHDIMYYLKKPLLCHLASETISRWRRKCCTSWASSSWPKAVWARAATPRSSEQEWAGGRDEGAKTSPRERGTPRWSSPGASGEHASHLASSLGQVRDISGEIRRNLLRRQINIWNRRQHGHKHAWISQVS